MYGYLKRKALSFPISLGWFREFISELLNPINILCEIIYALMTYVIIFIYKQRLWIRYYIAVIGYNLTGFMLLNFYLTIEMDGGNGPKNPNYYKLMDGHKIRLMNRKRAILNKSPIKYKIRCRNCFESLFLNVEEIKNINICKKCGKTLNSKSKYYRFYNKKELQRINLKKVKRVQNYH